MRKLWVLSLCWGMCLSASLPTGAQTYLKNQAGTTLSSMQPLFLSLEERWVLTQALQSLKANSGAQEIVSVLQTPAQIIEVNTMNEFLQELRGQWVSTGFIGSDLEEMPIHSFRQFKAKDPQVQKQIDRYLQQRNLQLQQILGLQLSLNEVSLGSVQQLQTLSQLSSKKTLQMLHQFINQEFAKISQQISNLTKNNSDSMGLFIQKAMNLYLSNLPQDRKEYIALQFLSSDLNKTDMEKMEFLIQNCGPQLQKLLQVLSRDPAISPEMSQIFKKLENQVQPVSGQYVEKVIENERADYKILQWDRKPLGVGTMAQVHRATILNEKQERIPVVVRFLKPGMKQRVLEDQIIIQKVARIMDEDPEVKKLGLPKLSPLVDDITRSVQIELNLENTKKQQKLATTAYSKDFIYNKDGMKLAAQFRAPIIYDSLSAQPSSLMVQELVVGQKLDKEIQPYEKLLPDFKLVVTEQLARMWVESVFMKSGFFHSDLHHGNIMVSIREPVSQIYILDYGMGGVLSPEMQKNIMALGLATTFEKPELIAKALWSLSIPAQNKISQEVLAQRMTKYLKSYQGEIEIEALMTWGMDQGLRLNPEIISLQRGLLTLTQMLKETGSKKTLLDINTEVAKNYPWKMTQLARELGLEWTDIFSKVFETKKAQPIPSKSVTVSCEFVLD